MRRIALFLFILFSFACNNDDVVSDDEQVNNNPAPPIINYTVVNSYPHDTASFTEGLLVHEGQLYESTGSPEGSPHNGSWLGKVDLKSGKALTKVKLDKMYFGEGISILNGKIYQLTYTTQKGFVYDAVTLKKIREFSYTGQGWSLTNDGTHLIMSDGTSNLRYLDPETLQVAKIVSVTDNNGPVANVNELEYINGFIYANIWLTNYIYKIDPASGKVVAKLDLSTLKNEVKSKYPGSEELNGIAYDAKTGKIYVTGKLWPNLYEVKF